MGKCLKDLQNNYRRHSSSLQTCRYSASIPLITNSKNHCAPLGGWKIKSNNIKHRYGENRPRCCHRECTGIITVESTGQTQVENSLTEILEIRSISDFSFSNFGVFV